MVKSCEWNKFWVSCVTSLPTKTKEYLKQGCDWDPLSEGWSGQNLRPEQSACSASCNLWPWSPLPLPIKQMKCVESCWSKFIFMRGWNCTRYRTVLSFGWVEVGGILGSDKLPTACSYWSCVLHLFQGILCGCPIWQIWTSNWHKKWRSNKPLLHVNARSSDSVLTLSRPYSENPYSVRVSVSRVWPWVIGRKWIARVLS